MSTQARRISKLIWRKRHRGRIRVVGSLGTALLALLIVMSMAVLIGRMPVWATVPTLLFVVTAGLIGEAIARSWEERDATEAEVTFANQFVWAMEDTMEVSRIWRDDARASVLLSELAQYAPDSQVARFADQSLRILSASPAPLR